eukprot:8493534-Alexandrium_andersonii.AAC.1
MSRVATKAAPQPLRWVEPLRERRKRWQAGTRPGLVDGRVMPKERAELSEGRLSGRAPADAVPRQRAGIDRPSLTLREHQPP